jgi:hypothetical protein
MFSWAVRLATRSVALRFFGISLLLLLQSVLPGQLTTGTVEGVLRDPDGRLRSNSEMVVTGGAGFRAVFRTNSHGEFALTLPYGRYDISGVTLTVAPFQIGRVDLVVAEPAPGRWADATRGRVYPEGFNLVGVLLSREPASVSEPLDFTGVGDNRLALESQRGFSWTHTQFRLNGIDATDSYQPGRALILPDIEALDEVVVRSAFAQTTSPSYGTDVGLFLAEPTPSWHGSISNAATGAFLSSTNLPPQDSRGIVQQPDRFNWFTRDRVEIGGPLSRRADFFASAAGQWASQTAPLASSGTDQRSRLLFGNARTRIQASARDQIDALYSGSRIDLSGGGAPAGLEALTGRRMAPSFVLPGGFRNQAETDHLDFLQLGWTRQSLTSAGLGLIQVRYGFSTAHLDAGSSVPGSPQSRIELLSGAVTGAPPLGNLAVRTRQELEVSWQPSVLRVGGTRHQITLGAGWKTSAPLNRLNVAFDSNLITAGGEPAAVVELNTPIDSRELVRSFSGYIADHLNLTRTLIVEAGGIADLSRGSVPNQSSPAGHWTSARTFTAQQDLIVWNSISPRAGFAWQVPHIRGLVLRGAYLRLYSPLAARYLDFGNPNSLGGSVYEWTDRNADGWFQPGEQGALLQRFGGPFSSISPSLRREHSDEFNLGAGITLPGRGFASIHVFRHDDKDRIAAMNTGVPAQAFQPRVSFDPGPDGMPGTFDDGQLIVYDQTPATLGQDRYLLTNPAGLRMLNAGLAAEVGTQWKNLTLHASFVAEESYGPTNPGNAIFENDPGVVGALFLDPNTTLKAAGRIFTDRAYVGKIQSTYRLPKRFFRIEVATVADYTDGLAFARQLLVTGLTQGPLLVPATVRGSPEGGNRAQYVINWNLRLGREFAMPAGRVAVWVDLLNVTNAGQRIQENDLNGPSFNLRLPVAIQPPRTVRFGFRYVL